MVQIIALDNNVWFKNGDPCKERFSVSAISDDLLHVYMQVSSDIKIEEELPHLDLPV